MKTNLKILMGMLFLLLMITGCKDDSGSSVLEKEYADTIEPKGYSFIETITYKDDVLSTLKGGVSVVVNEGI